MPRAYDLGRRAAPKAETHARIVRATLGILLDAGSAGLSNLAIAKAADVAPATVRNHFPEQADLLGAAFEVVLEEIKVPDDSIFAGVAEPGPRVERLAHALADLYERGQPWWQALEREPELIQAWGGGVERYYADVERLMRVALGDLGSDARSMAVVAAVIGPPTFFGLRGRGMSSEDAVQVTLELAIPWLEARRAALRDRSLTTAIGAMASEATTALPRRSARART